MNKVSPCCHGEVVEGFEREYPVGGIYYIDYGVNVCEECGQPFDGDPLEACDICGEIDCYNECEDEGYDAAGFSEKVS